MARNIGRGHSRCGAGNRNRCNARHSTRFGRDGAIVVHGFWKSILSGVVEPADRFVNGSDLQLRHLALRRMARASMGSDIGADDARARYQHHRAILNQEEVLNADDAD